MPASNVPPPQPAPPPGRQSATALKVGLAGAVGLLVGLIVGSAGAGASGYSHSQGSAADPASAVPAGGGRLRVGQDLVPGTYQTSGPDGSTSTGCYYARLKKGDGSLGDILDNYVSQGPMTVTVQKSDGYFETSGCSTWTKVR
jgi:hypothetical protein